nr:MAG TPA: hypothetical protein [Caudoviricetes sp.]
MKNALFKAGKQCKNIVFSGLFSCAGRRVRKDDGRTGKADQ